MGMYEEEEDNRSFARKYRPVSFDGYIGNQDIKETVMRYFKSKRPQTALLHGNSGCGKTTLSRILARECCCENRDPEKGACGECMSCQMFNSYITTGVIGDLTDVYEIDASKSGKNDVNSMLESMEYPAMSGNWKVYIMDEAHLLSDSAMGSLLKSLEEPPEGVFIMLCTTNPEKLLDTIRNRCQMKLAIQKPGTSEIVKFLSRVCVNEGKDYDMEGLRMISGISDNVVRDSLNNLETVLATRGSAKTEAVSLEFRQVTDNLITKFYQTYFEDNYVEYTNVLYRIKTEYNFSQFLISLTNFTLRGIYIINGIDVEGLTAEEIKTYKSLFSKFSPKEISTILRDLKRMDLGSIEANLMSFIYCKGTDVEEQQSGLKIPKTITAAEEKTFRNDNLQKIEQAKLAKGTSSIASEIEEVVLTDVLDMFNLEKVDC